MTVKELKKIHSYSLSDHYILWLLSKVIQIIDETSYFDKHCTYGACDKQRHQKEQCPQQKSK